MGGKEVRNDSNLVFDCFSEAVINLRKKVHSGSRFRREKSPPRQKGRAASGGRSRQLRGHISNHKHQLEVG